MRAAVLMTVVPLAACAARAPLDFIPPEELLMIEAAERRDAQAQRPARPVAEPDLAAQYAAALAAAGVEPLAPARDDTPPPPPPRPRAAAADAGAARPIPGGAEAASTEPARTAHPASPSASPTATPPAPAGPISVEEMLARVRAQAGASR